MVHRHKGQEHHEAEVLGVALRLGIEGRDGMEGQEEVCREAGAIMALHYQMILVLAIWHPRMVGNLGPG